MAKTEQFATDEIASVNPDALGKDGGNGWVIGTTNYQNDLTTDRLSVGNLGFTTQLFWEYYAYTKDETVLRQVYDVLANAARFITKMVTVDEDGHYLVANTDSPEMRVDGKWYVTDGTTYSQTFAYLNNYNALLAARELGIDLDDEELLSSEEYSILKTVMEQIDKYDPIVVGLSGQVKEFREEDYYGSVGDDPHHRHISQLVGLFPGNLITASTPAWLDAARVTLEGRGNNTTGGWVYSNKIGLFARAELGEKAYEMIDALISKSVQANLFTKLWNVFQIDANFGATAGMTEMLLQSQDGYIAPLAAIPEAWATGSYTGLVARGGFEVSAAWENGVATAFNILSNNGGSVSVKYPSASGATVVRASDGRIIDFTASGDVITFDTNIGETYIIKGFKEIVKPEAPANFDFFRVGFGSFNLEWAPVEGAACYNVYVAKESAKDYTLIASVESEKYSYNPGVDAYNLRTTFAVTAIGADGTESERSLCYYNPIDTSAKVNDVSGHVLESGEFQVVIDANEVTAKYRLYEKAEGASDYVLVTESGYPIIIESSFNKTSTYAVSAISFFEGTESEKVVIRRLNGDTASYNPHNIFIGKEFIGTTAANPTPGYEYSKLTDGIIDRNNAGIGRFSSNWKKPVDGTVDLQGKYVLSNLRVYVFANNFIQLGNKFTVQVFSNGEWTTVFYRDTVAELSPFYDAATGTLDIDLGAVTAERVRIYATPDVANGQNYVTYYEVECSGILIGEHGEYSENILSGKKFTPINGANTHVYGGGYGYDCLTDGIIEGFKGRFSTKKHGSSTLVYANATADLGGEYVLSRIKLFDYSGKTDYSDNSANYLGENFKLEIFSEGKWITIASYANPADIQANHRVKTGKTGYGEAWIEFDLKNMKASAIRFYGETGTISNASVSLFEITCSGYLVEDQGEENILLGKSFTPTDEAKAAVIGSYSQWGYPKLTDGSFDASAGRFSTNYGKIADATADLGGEYALSSIRFYDLISGNDFETSPNWVGSNFKLEVLTRAGWKTVAEYATAEEFVAAHRVIKTNKTLGGGWLEIGLSGIIATKIRFSSTAISSSTVSFYEIECFGTKVSEAGEKITNILKGKEAVPTTAAYNSIYSKLHGTYGYSKLTDDTGTTRMSTNKGTAVLNATIDLGGKYMLDKLAICDHYDNNSAGTASFVGQDFKIEVLSDGKWVTVISYADNADIEANHRVTGSYYGSSKWLEFDMGGIVGTAIRVSSKALPESAISIKEITCSAYPLTDVNAPNSSNVFKDSNVTLISGSAADSSSVSNLTDGDHSTYFEAKATDSYTLEFDLGYTRSVHEIRIYELIGEANLIGGVPSTASDKTTIEVYNNGAWVTAASDVSLDALCDYNTFELYGIECNKIRITFKNTRLFDSETAYRCAVIREIECSYINVSTDLAPLLETYKKISTLNPYSIESYNNFKALHERLTAVSLSESEAVALNEDMQAFHETSIGELVSGINFAPKTSITLGDNLLINIYIPLAGLTDFTVDGQKYDNLEIVKVNGEDHYHLIAPVAAAEGTREIKLNVTVNAEGNRISGSFTISIPRYVKNVLAISESETEKQVVRDVLSYIKAAIGYFDADNTEAIALIESIIGARYDETSAYTPEGSTVAPEGLSYATFALDSVPALMLYLPEGADASRYSFKIGGRSVDFTPGEDSLGAYAKINFYAYAMCETVDILVDGEKIGAYHIASYYEWAKTQGNNALTTLVERFWKYCQSARDYRNSIRITINYKDKSGNTVAPSKTLSLKGGAEYSVPSPAISGYYTRDLYVKGTASKNTAIDVVYKEIPKSIDEKKVSEILPNVVAWGDSITNGALHNDVTYANKYGIDLTALGSAPAGLPYVDVLENLIKARVYSGIDVANCGVGSDTTCQIAARANTETNYLYLGSEFVVSNSSAVIPLMHQAEYGRLGILRKEIRDTTSNIRMVGTDENGNEVTVTGKLTATLSSAAPSGTDIKTCDFSLIVYTFTRTDGKTDKVTFAKGARIETQESYIYDGRTCIIFMGENGGYNYDFDVLIRQQEEILEACGNPEYYLIISSTSQSTAIREPITKALSERWGEHYINMGNELNSSRKSYELAGYSEEVIAQFLGNIIDGTVAYPLIKDGCHPNAVGYAVAANIMFERMFDIGVFDAIFDYYDSLEA